MDAVGTIPLRTHGRGILAALIAVMLPMLLALTMARADAAYPSLTGRVVDDANVIDPATRQAIEGKLKDLEDKSGIQLVVATVPGLDGVEIEPYANRLFRAWKLGEAKKNNGALMLVAPKEKRVRIEVGYGLEGTLTDAISKIIITNAMVPRFKTGDVSGGIARGTDDIITVLSTDASDWQKKPDLRETRASDGSTLAALLPFLIFGLVVFVMWRASRRGGRGRGGWGGGPWIVPPMGGGWSGGGGGSFGGGSFSDGGGGGFSGGGGSSGGGGASGSW